MSERMVNEIVSASLCPQTSLCLLQAPLSSLSGKLCICLQVLAHVLCFVCVCVCVCTLIISIMELIREV